jgi:hypothetical protein
MIDFFMGSSNGRWEGDTLVVEVTNNNDRTWFDRAGNHHSDAMRLVERYTRIGPDHLQYEVTVTDPRTFSRPWKMSMPLYHRIEPGAELLEYECFDAEEDAETADAAEVVSGRVQCTGAVGLSSSWRRHRRRTIGVRTSRRFSERDHARRRGRWPIQERGMSSADRRAQHGLSWYRSKR